MKLLKKEFRLCLHPTALLMPWLGALILTPNYPYAVSFFYMTLGIFFVCLTARENHDAAYTMTLPVSRKQAVEGRMLFACCLEIFQLALCGVFLLIKGKIGNTPNAAGLDAGVAVLGDGLLLFTLFNLIFFPAYYRDVNKVGKAFVIASAAVFFYIVLGIAATYALPFVRDALDTPDPAHMTEKVIFLAVALVIYIIGTVLALRLSVKRFEQLDLQL